MSEKTFHKTSEDLRKMESRESKRHGGKTPADSDASILKSIVSQHKPNPDRVQANLELPQDPPGSSDMKSADARYHTGVGSGRISGGVGGESDALREPVAQESAVRVDGDKLHKGTVV
ncbi:hypothetical protein BZA77DRAFT_105194 [Pyronema omphalodes]|nr:hypothetical protein BZA77DRAFT_105194 [Pyronema omphalodes]